MNYKIQSFVLNRKMLPTILFQRNELFNSFQKRVRRIFGRFIFTNLFIYLASSKKIIEKKYFAICKKEFDNIKNYFPRNINNVLSIGCGVGGLEYFFSSITDLNSLYLIDRNFVSKKIIYGFNTLNTEGYNNLDCTRDFLISNKFPKTKFKIIDYDKDKLPYKKYDLIISLLSLDFHYPFSVYKDYIRKVSTSRTVLILDTNRPNYFKSIYKKVKIIKKVTNNIHPYCRIVCKGIIN